MGLGARGLSFKAWGSWTVDRWRRLQEAGLGLTVSPAEISFGAPSRGHGP